MDTVIAHLSIGDFSRATHMTVKTLRHYHRIGLLEPTDVDPYTGYRRYTAEQIPAAQVIRRLRDLDMPLDEIRAVLATSDPRTRGERIASHLSRLEDELERRQRGVAALRDLLAPAAPDASADIGLRSLPATPAAAIAEVVDADESVLWLQGALGELYATLFAQGVPADGPAGGVFADELFTHHRGHATVFVPCAGPVRPVGRVVPLVVPPVELAVIAHTGPPTDVDRAYGTLAAHVTRHALAVDGPIREYYLVGPRDTPDPSRWRTEIGWPVFHIGGTPRNTRRGTRRDARSGRLDGNV